MREFYVAGDWGTSNLRLFLVKANSGEVRERQQSVGVTQVDKGEYADVLAHLSDAWKKRYGALSFYLCGMVGSNIGWVNTDYVACPLTLETLRDKLTTFQSGGDQVTIIPGINCRNPLDAADVIRGEETQILGALQSYPRLQQGEHLLCLPGTHSKWVNIKDSQVLSFCTSICGELFALLSGHGVLVKDGQTLHPDDGDAFINGVLRGNNRQKTDLIHLLFETRSRQINGELSRQQAMSFMSGLIIGRDIVSAGRLFNMSKPCHITYIGHPRLTGLYLRATHELGLDGGAIDGDTMAQSGIHSIYLALQHGKLNHAN